MDYEKIIINGKEAYKVTGGTLDGRTVYWTEKDLELRKLELEMLIERHQGHLDELTRIDGIKSDKSPKVATTRESLESEKYIK